MKNPMKQYNNLQDIYDTAVAGLASQGFQPAYNTEYGGPSCAYRGTEGRKCAIGWCIPDELYSPAMEHKNIKALLVGSFKDSLQGLFPDSISTDTLLELQKCHDNYVAASEATNVVEMMRKHLRIFGLEHNLQIPESLAE